MGNTHQQIQALVFLIQIQRQNNLKVAVRDGHRYWILDEKISGDDAMILSEWRNSDNNTNQVTHEIQILRSIQRYCRAEAKTSTSVKVATIIAKVSAASIVKLNPNVVGILVKFCVELGVEQYVDEICEFHSSHVNPNEMACPHGLMEEICKSIKKENVLVRVNLVLVNYTKDNGIKQMEVWRDNDEGEDDKRGARRRIRRMRDEGLLTMMMMRRRTRP